MTTYDMINCTKNKQTNKNKNSNTSGTREGVLWHMMYVFISDSRRILPPVIILIIVMVLRVRQIR